MRGSTSTFPSKTIFIVAAPATVVPGLIFIRFIQVNIRDNIVRIRTVANVVNISVIDVCRCSRFCFLMMTIAVIFSISSGFRGYQK